MTGTVRTCPESGANRRGREREKTTRFAGGKSNFSIPSAETECGPPGKKEKSEPSRSKAGELLTSTE